MGIFWLVWQRIFRCFKFVTMMLITMHALWDITPCWLVNTDVRMEVMSSFAGSSSPRKLTLKKEALYGKPSHIIRNSRLIIIITLYFGILKGECWKAVPLLKLRCQPPFVSQSCNDVTQIPLHGSFLL
jgi:hypothetical protein